MPQPFALSTFALLRRPGQAAPTTIRRPDGPLMWFHCLSSRHVDFVRSIMRSLDDQPDAVRFLLTGTGQDPVETADRTLIFAQGPGETRNEINTFLSIWQPDAIFWLGGNIDPVLLSMTEALPVKRYLIDAQADIPGIAGGGWFPGLRRAALGRLDMILTADSLSAVRLRKQGARGDRIYVTGAYEEETPVLSCNDAERDYVSETLGTRPVWLAVDCPPKELDNVIAAHQAACRRSHRLLLIVVPRSIDQGPEFVQRLESAGFETVLRSQGDPGDTTRALVADLDGELGMWYRISPLCFMGGTLTSSSRHPYEAAALGSIVIHGPMTGPYDLCYSRLDGAGGACAIRNGAELGDIVETLQAPDKAAQIAHSAWDVTSRSAAATNRVAELIRNVVNGVD